MCLHRAATDVSEVGEVGEVGEVSGVSGVDVGGGDGRRVGQGAGVGRVR